MPLKYLIDENLRGKFGQALLERGLREGAPLDSAVIGEDGAPALGTLDEDLLRWCELQGRVLVSLDTNTLPDHLEQHIAAGHSSPGVFLIRRTRSWEDVMGYLVLCAEAMGSAECANRCIYIPE